MRRLFYILLILLLPLRGWAGDAMALQMALPDGMSHMVGAAPTHGAGHHAAQADPRLGIPAANVGGCTDLAASDVSAAPNNHCQTCALCQTCHSMAITPSTKEAAGTEQLKLLPPPVAHDFASAENALRLKPPIS